MASLKDIKLASFTWDSDKSPNGFTKFMENWSSIVRAVHGGDELECFLDRKLGRSRSSKALVPTFISQDPEFAAPTTQATRILEAEGTYVPFGGVPAVGPTTPSGEAGQGPL